MNSQAAPAPLRAEDLYDLPDGGRRYELVRGELREVPPASFRHGRVCMRVGKRIDDFVEERRLGVVVVNDTGFILERDPDTVRGPDVAFVAAQRVPIDETGFAELAPDLVVEVVSPNDRASEVSEKARQYLDAGVRLVWVVDPRSRTATVHRPDGGTVLIGDAALDGEDVLPGFRLPLPDLFA
jgi:Uma2 family endonuclease